MHQELTSWGWGTSRLCTVVVIHHRLGVTVGHAATVLGSLKTMIGFQNGRVQVEHLLSESSVDLMTLKQK